MGNYSTIIRGLPFSALNRYRIAQQVNVGSESRLTWFYVHFLPTISCVHGCNKRI